MINVSRRCRGVICACLFACAPWLRAGTVTTRSGQTLQGEIKLVGEKIVIATENTLREVLLAEVKKADFSSLSPTTPKPGHGLRGEYFAGRGLSKLLLTRTDPQVAHDWGESAPHPALTPTGREFSVRWTGRLRPPATQTYRLITNTDDGVRLWLDGNLLIDRWYDQSGGEHTAEAKLDGNKAYDLKVEYYNATGRAGASLAWSSPHLPRQVIAHEHLLSPQDDPPATMPQRILLKTPAADSGPEFVRVLKSDRSGLRGEYFEDRDLKQLRFVRIDPSVDFNFHAENLPDPTSPAEGSVRWTGMIQAPRSEDYRFHVEVHRRVRLWVDEQLVIDQWKGEGGEYTSMKVSLTAGKKVPFKLEYTSPDGFMICRVRWSSQSTPRDVVPPEAFSLVETEKSARPVLALLSPEAGAVVAAPSSIKLSAAALSPNGKITKVEYFDRSTLLGAATAPSTGDIYEARWDNPEAGVYPIWARLTDSAGITALTEPQLLTVTGKGDGSLKSPWGDFYIANNEFKTPGKAGMKNGDGAEPTYRIDEALGTLVAEGEHDAGHFIIQPLTGDGQIVARVASLDPADPIAGAMAGITLRENLKNRCKTFSMLYGIPVTDPVVSFVRRQEHWMNPATTERQIGGPYWLKLVRHGDRVHGYTSPDGKNWDLLGSEKFESPPQAYVGLVAFSRDRDKPASVVFDHVEVTPGSPALASAVKGFLTRGGTFIAADVTKVDDNFIHYHRDNKSHKIPAKDVARVLFKPMLAEHAQKLTAGRTGALMSNGDFIEGEIRGVKEGHAQVSSVLFGLRRIAVNEDLVAVVLNEPTPAKALWEVATRDGSVYRARGLRQESDEILMEDASMGKLGVPQESLLELRTLTPSPAGDR
jgi:hypothetical protein